MTWGDYRYVEIVEGDAEPRKRGQWQRAPRAASAGVPQSANGKPISIPLAGTGGLKLVASVREVSDATVSGDRLVPKGTKAVSVFLVSDREPAAEERRKSEAMVFQAGLRLRCGEGFVARPNLAGLAAEEWDERVATRAVARGRGPTSRVGRDDERPGLVVTLLKPRLQQGAVLPLILKGA